MTTPRKRAFIVMDLEEFDGDACDLAMHIEARIRGVRDTTVYASIEDMLADRKEGNDMFEREVDPINVPNH